MLIALDGERGRGSGRSGCEAFDLLAGLTACGEHLRRYGGHRAAAGLEIERERVPGFADALAAYAGSVLSRQDTAAVERVDAVVGGVELGMALAEELRPAGAVRPGQPAGVAAARRRDVRRRAADGRRQACALHRALARRARARRGVQHGGRLRVAEGEPAQATFTLEVNEWNGVSEPRLVLRHASAAGVRAGADTAILRTRSSSCSPEVPDTLGSSRTVPYP